MNPEKQEANATKLAQLLRTALEELKTPAYRGHLRFWSLDAWFRFTELKDAGFTEAQALQIVIERK